MNAIDFDDLLWGAEIEHRNSGTDGLWFRALNADDEESAIKRAIRLFESEGLMSILIDRINIYPLESPGG